MSGVPGIGEKAPDFELQDAYGKRVRLSQFTGRAIIVVFTRHLGCLLTRAHLTQLRQQYGKIQHVNAEVVVVSFEEPEGIRKMISAHKVPFPFLRDPDKAVYRVYGMMRPEAGAVTTWKTAVAYLRLRLAGYPKYRPGSDVRQMGGDVVIDGQGVIRFAHRSRYPEDQPEVTEIMRVLTEITGRKP